MEVEAEADCRFDTLYIHDGESPSTSTELAKICGYGPQGKIAISGSIMRIDFLTDYSVTKKGFVAEFGIAANLIDSEY